jgi:exonuclease III
MQHAPQIICLTEHHCTKDALHNVTLGSYTLAASYCRETYTHGGVCIYVDKSIKFSSIALNQFSKEKDLEICAVKLNLSNCNIIVLCIYIDPLRGTCLIS